MRKLLALVALLCGAVSAQADALAPLTPYCSDGFAKPAVLTGDGQLTIGGEAQHVECQYFAEVVTYDKGAETNQQSVMIFRDRVFWPCEAK